MTCIVGLVDDGKVHIGADSSGISGWSLSTRKDRKVFKNGPFVIGFTSSFRMGQLLQYSLSPPSRHPEKDTMAFLAVDFVDAIRACLKNGGSAKKESEEEKGGTFLVGYEGRLFAVHADYQVEETIDGFAACGCGQDAALGALFAAKHLPARDRLQLALEAAERFSAGVRGPFYFEVA